MEIDDKFLGYIMFVEHTENEGFVLTIMNEVNSIKKRLNSKFKNVYNFEELIETSKQTSYSSSHHKVW